uniref:Uncharacterized protein n=1 Tax=Picea glauca TaxID=3330 RepID=A0A101LVK8_PICGL|nr:hypothetical protein ABT39_MTgene1946 [Picea glauca]
MRMKQYSSDDLPTPSLVTHLASQPGFRKASLKAGNVNQASSRARPPWA